MCNLYSQRRSRDEVARLFRIGGNRIGDIPDQPSIFPGWDAPVVRLAEDGERECVTMNWGFVLPIAGKAPRRVTNARDDTILTSKFWSTSFETRRCLVPVSSYCEPTDDKPARWSWFALRGNHPRPLFAFAGIWRRWGGPVKKDGPAVTVDTYAIATTKPNALTASINHERMPVLLADAADHERWLQGNSRAAFALLRPFDPALMRIVQQGSDKKDLLADVAARKGDEHQADGGHEKGPRH